MTASMYAFVVGGQIKERRNIDLATVPAHKTVLWLPIATVGDGAFDPATQKKTGPVTVVDATQVTDTWTIANKTAQELSDEKDAKISAIDLLQFKVSFDIENRVRALEGKAAITAAQYKAALKAAL